MIDSFIDASVKKDSMIRTRKKSVDNTGSDAKDLTEPAVRTYSTYLVNTKYFDKTTTVDTSKDLTI